MHKKLCILTLTGIICLGLSVKGFTQEDMDTDFMSGVVKEVSEKTIGIVEFGKEESTIVRFTVTEETVFENVASIGDVEIGNEVYIDFIVSGTDKLAVVIYRMDHSTEDLDFETFSGDFADEFIDIEEEEGEESDEEENDDEYGDDYERENSDDIGEASTQ